MSLTRVFASCLAGLSATCSVAASDAPAALEDVAFAHAVVAEASAVTSIEVSPDGDWLYAVTLAGLLHRWPVDPETGGLGAIQTLSLPYFTDPAGPRGLIGLAFDPVDPLTAWVTDNHPVALFGANERRPDFTGRVSRVRIAPGETFAGVAEPYVTGLPRSCGDHLSNSLRFRENPDRSPGAPSHLLYLTQGSNSSMGEADRSWCYRPERLLSAAVLEIDPSRTPPAGGFDVRTEPVPEEAGHRRFGYSLTLAGMLWSRLDGALKNQPIPIDAGEWSGRFLLFGPDGVASVLGRAEGGQTLKTFYDPFAPDAPVRLFATGIRNGYDLVWHSNGWLYVPSNGPVAGGATPDDPRTPIDEGVGRAGRTEDFLYQLRRGDYAGHPNPLRDEFVAHGGNPTADADPNEITQYPVGVLPDPRYPVERAHPLGFHWSPNGAVEYADPTRPSALDGALIIANFSKGNNLRVITLDAEGAPKRDLTLREPRGAEIVYADPLDLALGPVGRLYLATLARSNGRSKIVLLQRAAVEFEPHAQ